MKKLEALEGEQFDTRYIMQGGVELHRNARRLLERTQKRATDPELQELATGMLPVINEHLTLAQEVRETITGASGDSMGPAGTPGTPGTTGSGGALGTPGASGSSGTSSTPGASDSSGAAGVSGTSGSSNSVGPGK